MTPWDDNLTSKDWETTCTLGCWRRIIKCPICGNFAHKGVWVNIPTDDEVVVVARHAHFVRIGLRDPARNWAHTIEVRTVDKRSFEYRRVIKHVEYLPRDIRRIFGEQ
jgi:hypothetical protein